MASNINYVNVDETFPVAGQDNDSQGFRDNFSTIRNGIYDVYWAICYIYKYEEIKGYFLL